MTSDENLANMEVRSGDFGECLVGGSAEEQRRRRKVKRRALAVSIVLQSLGLGVVVIAPMLAKPSELSMRTVPPIPIYRSRPARQPAASDPARKPPSGPCFRCAINSKPQIIQTPAPPNTEATNEGPVILIPGSSESSELSVAHSAPQPPSTAEKAPTRRLVHTSINPAMLVHRVEPVFPALARQTHRSGKVELRAIIATDGSIQSLEVVSGDRLFIESALDAVRQWRYRPTYLNGEPVEIDTFITVVYTLNQQ